MDFSIYRDFNPLNDLLACIVSRLKYGLTVIVYALEPWLAIYYNTELVV